MFEKVTFQTDTSTDNSQRPNNVPAPHEPHRLDRLCGSHLDHRQLCTSGLAHLPHSRCERHFAEHVQLVHGGGSPLVGLRHLDGGLAHHHCQHDHHQFGVDDFADEAALPLKIECKGNLFVRESAFFTACPLFQLVKYPAGFFILFKCLGFWGQGHKLKTFYERLMWVRMCVETKNAPEGASLLA